jgi:hypothetical protein
MRIALTVLLWAFAAVGVLASALALWIWLAARPVLDEARAQYMALPAEQQCAARAGAFPPGYPRSTRDLQSEHSAEQGVYDVACDATVGLGACAYMTGAPRWIGFTTLRPLYLSDCELRAVNLRAETPLRRSLERLYPGRAADTLDEAELTCLSRRTRYGSSNRYFCERSPECCAASASEGLTERGEAPR